MAVRLLPKQDTRVRFSYPARILILMKNFKNQIPTIVSDVWKKLIDADYKAYLVGGCVRDLILGKKPKDWDITTNAKPEEIVEIFGVQAFYENAFGTVGVKTYSDDMSLAVIEITSFRLEGKYSDLRHPDEVKFSDKLEDDLQRRDFTINALALDQNGDIVDEFNGLNDLDKKLIRTVGKPEDRFREDALRMMRAIRLAVELGFEIEKNTFDSIKELANLIQYISRERIKDELVRIIMQKDAMIGIEFLREGNLLIDIIPELAQSYNIKQNKHHKFDVYTHSILSLNYAAKKDYSFEVRFAALLHDIAKPLTKQGEYPSATFYNHEIIGAKLVKNILVRLRFSNKIISKVTHLVRHHMFYLEVDKVTASAVRRLVKRVGEESLEDLFKTREADRIGSGVPKAVPYRLRYLKYLIKKVAVKPITPQMLKINGDEIMEILQISSSPRIGWVLKALLEEVLDEPKKNDKKYLLKRVEELGKLSDEDLKKLAFSSEEKKREIEEEIDKEIKEEFRV